MEEQLLSPRGNRVDIITLYLDILYHSKEVCSMYKSGEELAHATLIASTVYIQEGRGNRL